MPSLAALRRAARLLPAQRYLVDRPIDERGQYQRELSAEFPFEINRLIFPARLHRPLTWHNYLEIFILLSSACRRQMGDALLRLSRGDVLVMDHLRLHAVTDFPEPEAEALVIRFMPEMVRSAATAASDRLLLLPFYCHIDGQPHVVRAGEPAATGIHSAIVTLLECYATAVHSPYWQTGSRAAFLLLLHRLACRFQAAERLKDLFSHQQIRIGRLQKVFAHVDEHYTDRISPPQMAAKAGLSPQRFFVLFKKATGMTLGAYVTQVRLTHAARRLQESNQSIAEIANAVGFADQSYFDRRFRRHFGITPLQFRRGAPPARV